MHDKNSRRLLERGGRVMSNALNRLSPQEKKVAMYIAHGYDNQEIADLMHVKKRTIAAYMTQCLNRFDIPLGGASRVRLARKIWEEI